MTDRNQLLQDYRGWLYAVANNLTTPDRVDDVAQEGYIAMWRALGTYRAEKGSLPTWLTGAARMRMKDVAIGHGQPTGHVGIVGSPGSRRDSRDKRPSATGSVALEGLSPVAMDDLDERNAHLLSEGLAMAYHRGQIHQALARLPEEQRTYVVMRFWYSMTDTEIQKVLPSNVTHLWRGPKGARARLRLALKDLEAAA